MFHSKNIIRRWCLYNVFKTFIFKCKQFQLQCSHQAGLQNSSMRQVTEAMLSPQKSPLRLSLDRFIWADAFIYVN